MPTRTEIKEIEEIRDSYPTDVAGRLRAFRKKRNIKQVEFAEKLGIDIQKCRRYERAKEDRDENLTEHTTVKKRKSPEPDVETLKAMASILNITVDELVGYKPATIDIATDILTKAGIAFRKEDNNDTFVLYRFKTKEESDAYYTDPLTNDLEPFDDQNPDLLDVYGTNESCSFEQIPYKYGFMVYDGKKTFIPEVPDDGKGLRVFTRLTDQQLLAAIANGETTNMKVFYDWGNSDKYESREVEDVLSNIKTINLTTAEMKACVFEAKRRTDALIKTVLNNTYAAFYPTVFRSYIYNEKYSTWSVELVDKLPEKFSERLRKLRELNNCSQAKMAAAVGLSLQTYNRYETQDAQPSIDLLKIMALTLGISVDQLTGFKMDYINETLNFLKKVNIKCTHDGEPDLYSVHLPEQDLKNRTGKSLLFCAFKAKEEVDRMIAANLKNIFDETFTPIFWELVNHSDNMPDVIIDENDYEPYLFGLELMNKPTYGLK